MEESPGGGVYEKDGRFGVASGWSARVSEGESDTADGDVSDEIQLRGVRRYCMFPIRNQHEPRA